MNELSSVFDAVDTRDTTLYAALDIGSNSFHLVIARSVANALQVVQRVKNKVRLADGLDEQNKLSEAAMERALSTLQSMAESLQGIPASNVRVVATHTLRKARNARSFMQKARGIFPYPIEIISGPEEARLIYLGVSNDTSADNTRLIVDIGGGSTEFALGTDMRPKLCKSVQIGCVSYQLGFFPDGVINQNRFSKAITSARQEIEWVVANIQKHEWQHAIGSSGTARAIAAVAAANSEEERPDGVIYASDLRKLIKTCCDKGQADTLDLDGLTDDRKAVFAAGLSILSAIFKSLKIKQMHTSSAALREGVLYELQREHHSKDVCATTTQSLATRYDVDIVYANKVLATCDQIYQQVAALWGIENSELKSLLDWAAMLHEVGLQINSRGVQRHSSYIIEQTDMPGFNQEQQKLIACLVRFHRKKIKINEIPTFANYSESTVYALLAILRVGIMLNINRQETQLPEFTVNAEPQIMTLGFPHNWFELSPLLLADIKQENRYLSHISIQLKIL